MCFDCNRQYLDCIRQSVFGLWRTVGLQQTIGIWEEIDHVTRYVDSGGLTTSPGMWTVEDRWKTRGEIDGYSKERCSEEGERCSEARKKEYSGGLENFCSEKKFEIEGHY